MIICSFSGGLGNQLFQFAAAVIMSGHDPTLIVADLSQYEDQAAKGVTYRRFRLNDLGLNLVTVENSRQARLLRLRLRLKSRIAHLLFKPYQFQEIHEIKPFQTDSRIQETLIDTFLNGYWQVSTYALRVVPTLRERLFPIFEQIASREEIIKSIDFTRSVAVHVRRGDYVSSGLCCDAEYYKNAVKKIKEIKRIKKIDIYIFSDDLDWCMTNLKFEQENCYFPLTGKQDELLDFSIITRFKSIVISNSSFGWWAGFVSSEINNDATIVGPVQWWHGFSTLNTEIFPLGWHSQA